MAALFTIIVLMRNCALPVLLLAFAGFAQSPAPQSPAPQSPAVDPQYAAVAAQLVAAPDEPARQAILEANLPLLNHSLVAAVNTLGRPPYDRGNLTGSLGVYEIACGIARRIQDARGLAQCAFNTGEVLAALSRYDQALAALQEAVTRFTELGDKTMPGAALNDIGRIYRNRSQFDNAIASYESALKLLRASGDTTRQVRVLMNMGNAYRAAGKYDQAAQYLDQALQLARPLGNALETSDALLSLSGLYYFLRDMALVERYAQEALDLKLKNGITQSINKVYTQLAMVNDNLGHEEAARAHYEMAWKTIEPADRDSRLSVLYNYGNLLHKLNDHAGATAKLSAAAALADEIDRPSMAAHARVSLAEIANDETRWEDSISLTERGLTVGRATQDLLLIVRANDACGVALAGLSRYAEAESRFREAIASIEWMREHVNADKETTALYMRDKAPVYRHLVEALVADGKNGDALAVAEQAKARVVLDVLRSGRVDLARGMTPAEKQQEEDFHTRLATLWDAKVPSTEQLEQTRVDYRAFKNALYARHPELKVHRLDLDPASPAELMKSLPARNSALLEYLVDDKRIVLLVVTAGAAGAVTKAYTMPIAEERLEKDIAAFRAAIGARNLGFRRLAESLYRDLIQPAEAQLKGCDTLIVVPDAGLWQLPFQALQDGHGRYVIEDRALFYAPSLTVLREMWTMQRHGPAPNTKVLAVGATSLASTGREVMGLKSIYGAANTTVYLGSQADGDKILAEASHYGVLHLATHGVFRDRNPMSSYLVMAKAGKAEAGQLEARDLMGLNLHAGMVVLSACETGRGSAGGGEGLIGMSWALFVAGSPATIASQWKVDSASTSELMLDFHTRVHETGNKAKAMQQAAIALMKKPEYRHPFYWSGFVVMGQGF
jgi:CHAT domain-containing protein/Tfp pilus assembly protein PilF